MLVNMKKTSPQFDQVCDIRKSGDFDKREPSIGQR